MQVGKGHAATASSAQSSEGAEAAQALGIEMLRSVLVDQSKSVLYELQQLSKTIRHVPEIDLCVPTVSRI
jgi:hypothetical protein